jgi:O-antigen/teichoic acid export membrane protein
MSLPGVGSGGETPDSSQVGRGLFRNTLVNGAASIIVLAVTIAIVPFHIERLGDEAYGVWVLAASFSLSAGYLSLADLGLQQTLVKFVAEARPRRTARQDIDRYVRSASVLFLLLAAAAAVVMVVVAAVAPALFQLPEHLVRPLRLLLIVLGVEAIIGLPALAYVGLLEGLERFALLRAVELGRLLVFAFGTVIVLLQGQGLVAFGLVAIAASVVGHIGHIAVARVVWGAVRGSPSRGALRELRGFGGWLFVTKLTGTAWRQMDKTILAILAATSLLTVYEIANKVQGATAMILSFTSSAILPAAAGLVGAGEPERLRKLLLLGTRYTLALSLPAVGGLIAVAPELLVAWGGPEFAAALPATRLFLTAQLFVGTATMALSVLLGMGRVRRVALIGSFALAVNLGLSLTLVTRHGVEGVVAATVIAYAISTGAYVRSALCHLGIGWRTFLMSAVGGIGPLAIGFALGLRMLVTITGATSVGTIFLLVVGTGAVYAAGVAWIVFSAEERHTLVDYVRRGAAR